MSPRSQSAEADAQHHPEPRKTMSGNSSGFRRGVAVVLILAAVILLLRMLPIQPLLQPVQDWIDSLGVWGPLMLGLLYIVGSLLFIPGSAITLVVGAAYGLARGTIIVSLASTTAAVLAFLIARYLARDRVRARIEQSPRLAVVDQAIGEQGWKIVALLRLSPAVPFNLQNYLYGVTSIRFVPCVFTSWLAMLPGTFLYVYIGSLGKTAAAGRDTTPAEWAFRGLGLLATIVVSVYVARLARKAIRERTGIETGGIDQNRDATSRTGSD